MNQKGFTLVELMGILVILGVIIVFTVPSITKTLKNSETNELKEYQNTICLAAKSYVELENKGFPENNIKFSTESDYNINRFSKLLSNLNINHSIDINREKLCYKT